MKVLLIDQIAKVNYRYTYPLANGLVKQGIDVTLVIDKKEEAENCVCTRRLLFNTDEKNVGKLNKLINYIFSYRRIEKMLKKEKYDILHTEWYTFSPVDYWFIRKFKKKYHVKYVSTVHDILPFNKKLYDMSFHRKLYRLADSIILQAPGNIQRFAKLFPESKDKTHMIPHGHMLDYIYPVDQQESRVKLGIPNDKVVFLFFGQIKKVKGVDVLLSALVKLKDKHPEIYVIIAGSIWKTDFTECKSIIDKNNLEIYLKTDIRYIPDNDVKYYYSAADVCVLPYTNVYQSGVVQLAYGYKKPVIATRLDAFTQFVKEGETGFIAEPNDVESLAEAFERAVKYKNGLTTIGENGNKLVEKELSWAKLAKQIVEQCYICI